jgi:hypothetical protein
MRSGASLCAGMRMVPDYASCAWKPYIMYRFQAHEA